MSKIRVVIGEVVEIKGGSESPRQGLLAQKYKFDEEQGAGKWKTICPVTDAHFSLPGCPDYLAAASRVLRGMMERGEEITIDTEMQVTGLTP